MPDDPLQEAIALAYADSPFAPAQLDVLLASAEHDTDEALRAARLFAAARRAPRTLLERLGSVVRPGDREPVVRGLAGRSRADMTTRLPAYVSVDTGSSAEAAIVGRFGLAVSPIVDPTTDLASPDLDAQITGVRWLAAPETPLPDPEVMLALEPPAVSALARSLSQRSDVPPSLWTRLLETLAGRAHVATRRWGQAWRSVRDAAPLTAHPELVEPLRAAVANATPTQLPPTVAASWSCDNALALDRIAGGMPHETLQCAPPELAAIGQVAQAAVLGAAATLPDVRARALLALVTQAQGNAAVLVAVAQALAVLPPRTARPVLARLMTERDAGVMASVLEVLVAHPPLAATVSHTALVSLLAAPFALPGGIALEAQLNSVHLARILRLNDIDAQIAGSPLRAVHRATLAEAETPTLPARPPESPPLRVRLVFDTDAGSFEIELRPDVAPAAAATLLQAVRQQRYDGLTFHRQVPGFVVQGGDPRGDGYGGVDAPTPTELSLRPFHRGTVGVPLAGLDTGGIQFFIVLADTPQLDGRYPWIGDVVRGMDVVDGLMVGDVIHHVRIPDAPAE